MKNLRAQSGFALLIFMLVLLSMGGVIATGYLKTTHKEIENKKNRDTQLALQSAKAALLQYAYNYPDIPGTNGAGRLPCPDNDNDGLAESAGAINCTSGVAGFTMIGRFPYLQAGLNTEELKDGGGNELWYAVSHTFSWNKSAPNIINASSLGAISLSDTVGNIMYDSSADEGGIVAVIIAPGQRKRRYEPLNVIYDQVRTTAADRLDPKNYLEIAYGIDNATFQFGDRNTGTGTDDVNGFVLGPVYDRARNEFITNDQFITITREEILTYAFKKAAEDMTIALAAYQDSFPVPTPYFPWLYDGDYTNTTFDFVDPSTDIYQTQAFGNRTGNKVTEKGLIPILRDGDNYGTDLSFEWGINSSAIVNAGNILILDSDLTTVDTVSIGLGIGYIAGQCTWRDSGQVSCATPFAATTWLSESAPNVWILCPGAQATCPGGVPVRSYTLTFGNSLSFQNNPPVGFVRRAATSSITVDEVDIIFEHTVVNPISLSVLLNDPLSLYPVRLDISQYLDNVSPVVLESGFIDLGNIPVGYVPALNDFVQITTRYYPEANVSWVFENEWNLNMVFEYTNNYRAGGALGACVLNCISFADRNGIQNNINAVITLSGVAFTDDITWHSAIESDYFESENLIYDQIYTSLSADKNDVIKVINP